MATLPEAPSIARRPSLDAVLDYAWNVDVFTSGDALTDVGLTRSTTIEALDDLVALGLLTELPNARAAGEYTKGRPARRFEFAADHRLVVGVDAGRSHIVATVADLRGVTLAHHALDLGDTGDDADERRAAITRAIDDALAAASRTRGDVIAICVGVPAPVDRAGHSPAHPQGFWEAMNPALAEMLASTIPLVRIANDASLAAVAERAVGVARGEDDVVALLAGERLGAGVVIDGHDLHGAHGGVGEMLAMIDVRGVDDVSGIGKRMREWAAEALATDQASALRDVAADALDAHALLTAARSGDALAMAVRERAIELLTQVATVFASLYGSALIVVCGDVPDGAEDLTVPAGERARQRLDVPAPTILASTLGAEVVAIGAVRSAIDIARAGVLRLLCRA